MKIQHQQREQPRTDGDSQSAVADDGNPGPAFDISVAVVVRRMRDCASARTRRRRWSLERRFAIARCPDVSHTWCPRNGICSADPIWFLSSHRSSEWAERVLFTWGKQVAASRLCHEHLIDWRVGRTASCSALFQETVPCFAGACLWLLARRRNR